MLADPQTITVNTVAKTLNCVDRAPLASEYRELGGERKLIISTAEGKRNRSVMRVNHTKTAVDPLTAQTAERSLSVDIVVDHPKWGYTPTEIDYEVQGLLDWATSANVQAVISGQS